MDELSTENQSSANEDFAQGPLVICDDANQLLEMQFDLLQTLFSSGSHFCTVWSIFQENNAKISLIWWVEKCGRNWVIYSPCVLLLTASRSNKKSAESRKKRAYIRSLFSALLLLIVMNFSIPLKIVANNEQSGGTKLSWNFINSLKSP